jgi:hypothetical protein
VNTRTDPLARAPDFGGFLRVAIRRIATGIKLLFAEETFAISKG